MGPGGLEGLGEHFDNIMNKISPQKREQQGVAPSEEVSKKEKRESKGKGKETDSSDKVEEAAQRAIANRGDEQAPREELQPSRVLRRDSLYESFDSFLGDTTEGSFLGEPGPSNDPTTGEAAHIDVESNKPSTKKAEATLRKTEAALRRITRSKEVIERSTEVRKELNEKVEFYQNNLLSHPEANPLSQPIDIPAELFLSPEDLKKDYMDKKVQSQMAISKGTHKGDLIVAGERGNFTFYPVRFKGDEVKFGPKITPKITPTSYESGLDEAKSKREHLANVYVCVAEDGNVTIRCGKIDTQRKAEDFLNLVNTLTSGDESVPFNPKIPLRIIVQQLNSFETESKIIHSEHRYISWINSQLDKKKAQVAHINTPSNRFYNWTILLRKFGPIGTIAEKLYLKGERESAQQNLEGMNTYCRWLKEDILANHPELSLSDLYGDLTSLSLDTIEKNNISITENIKEIHDLQIKLKRLNSELSGIKRNTIEITEDTPEIGTPAEIRKNALELKRNEIKDAQEQIKATRKKIQQLRSEVSTAQTLLVEDLKKSYQSLAAIEQDLKEDPATLRKVILLKDLLGSQLANLGVNKIEISAAGARPVKLKPMERGKEYLVLQMLNGSLGISETYNCKSGLDRTGFLHALNLAHQQIRKQYTEEELFDVIQNWETVTKQMNSLTAKLGSEKVSEWINANSKTSDEELKKQMRIVEALRKEVLLNLVEIGIPITFASTGVAGMKWHKGRFKSNLLPLNFIPASVTSGTKEVPGKNVTRVPMDVPLVKYNKSGGIMGLTPRGHLLITKFQSFRGS